MALSKCAARPDVDEHQSIAGGKLPREVAWGNDGQVRQHKAPLWRRGLQVGESGPGLTPSAQGRGVPAHLREPVSDYGRSHLGIVDKNDARAAHGHPLIHRLQELAARCMDREWKMLGRELFRRANVEDVGGTVGLAE